MYIVLNTIYIANSLPPGMTQLIVKVFQNKIVSAYESVDNGDQS